MIFISLCWRLYCRFYNKFLGWWNLRNLTRWNLRPYNFLKDIDKMWTIRLNLFLNVWRIPTLNTNIDPSSASEKRGHRLYNMSHQIIFLGPFKIVYGFYFRSHKTGSLEKNHIYRRMWFYFINHFSILWNMKYEIWKRNYMKWYCLAFIPLDKNTGQLSQDREY